MLDLVRGVNYGRPAHYDDLESQCWNIEIVYMHREQWIPARCKITLLAVVVLCDKMLKLWELNANNQLNNRFNIDTPVSEIHSIYLHTYNILVVHSNCAQRLLINN